MTYPIRTLALLAMLAVAAPAFAQTSNDETNAIDDMPHVTIVGSARADIMPDLATITLGVTTERPTARDASEENARVAHAVLAAAKGAGIAASDIATQGVSLSESFEELHDASGRYTGRKPNGFVATNTMAVKLRDLAKAGSVAQSLIEAGANRFDGIGFSIEHPAPIQDRLAAEAVRNARRQAELVAEAAGVKLGSVVLIERPGAGRDGTAPVFTRLKAGGPSMPMEAGTVDVSVEMEVTWAIAQ